VYVTAFPGPGGKWRVSVGGGALPEWRRDNKEIFFFSPESRLMAAAVNGRGSTFDVSAVVPLFTIRPGGPRSFYAPAPDGQRFLVNGSLLEQTTSSSPITIVVNWTAGLKK
jgi:hypothetical protein